MPPGCEESVQQQREQQREQQHEQPREAQREPQHQAPDPPIYHDLLARWADAGRTLPGRRDPEWSRLTSSPIWPTTSSGLYWDVSDEPGDGRPAGQTTTTHHHGRR
ncbi:hypothetical protein [Streptomyces sp. NBC_01294]|uniref:hypothetical protein n=1 Tax=Streptomyces sp. NBC_01294 TaxID=2903815 RepID=UPI002DDBD001|nr:hypothetical protein [Streptomyces sp. NBC_01294]WRZ60474.1 hypothetical protein OG534_30690 [Streptomyces sp. NBC_01294]